MNKIAMIVHGGAGPGSSFIEEREDAFKAALLESRQVGYGLLQKGSSALDAVEAAVRFLEDDPLFNAGKGAALNARKEVEMCASIMDGKELLSGAVAIVSSVKNPVSLARKVLTRTEHNYLGGEGALLFARQLGLQMEPLDYFLTENQLKIYEEELQKASDQGALAGNPADWGTVGAVACDRYGNLAAATSTGGAPFSMRGRIADSSAVGSGVYARNDTCAISVTGDGEYIIKHVIAHDISAAMEYRGFSLEQAAHYVIHEKLKGTKAQIGIIGVTVRAEMAMTFNTTHMHRAWSNAEGSEGVAIY